MYCLLSVGLVLFWLLKDIAIRVMKKVKPSILCNVVHVTVYVILAVVVVYGFVV